MSHLQRKKIFEKVCHLVRQKHFDPALNGANWEKLVVERTDFILGTDERGQFEKQVQHLLNELRTSHTGFFHRDTRTIPARHAINATFKNCSVSGELLWVFQDVHEGGAAWTAGIRPGDVLLSIDDSHCSPHVPPVFVTGGSSIVTVRRPNQVTNRIQLNVPNPKNRKRPINVPRTISAMNLPSGIAYLKITMFPGAIGIDFANAISRTMLEFASCDGLIVDLRGNSGGGIGGLRLMSYLTANKTPIGYSLTRKRAHAGYTREDLPRFERIPAKKTALPYLVLKYAMRDRSICLYTEGLGRQKFHHRVALLVNEHSASAAEMVAAFAAENKLATIVGRKSAGRLLSGSVFDVGDGYMLGLPTAGYFTWNGVFLEGTGVTPDVEVDVTFETLAERTDPQLQKAIELLTRL